MTKKVRPTKCGHQPYCAKDLCRNCYGRELRRTNPEYAERQRANSRKHQRKATLAGIRRIRPADHNEKRKLRAYGLTIEDYNRLVEKQGNRCALCGSPPGDKKLAVDHDHQTNQVRGLLCFRCNFGLGWFKDDINQLRKLAHHLENGNQCLTTLAPKKKRHPNSKNIHVGHKHERS